MAKVQISISSCHLLSRKSLHSRKSTFQPGFIAKKRSLRGTIESFGTHRCDGSTVLRAVATDLFSSLDTAVSLSCEIMLRYGDLAQLARKTISSSDYVDPTEFRDSYQAVSFLKKVPWAIESIDPELAAKEKFYAAEAQCLQTNQRIRAFLANPGRVSAVHRESFSIVQRKIQEVLGCSVSYAEWMNSCRFGPGVFNAPNPCGLTSHYDKLQVNPSVTLDFSGPGNLLIWSSPPWVRSITGEESPPSRETFPNLCVTVPGNKVAFVPKTALTHRAIAIEPLMNIYAQLGLGDIMRRYLRKKTGIDLSDQTANQRAAQVGSMSGYLCTVDLTNASDTVSRELVRAILPDEWFSALDSCRSKVGWIDGKWLRYEKFSSMGNGFTFELETLIFWAIVSSACEIIGISDYEVLVYGDDIVVPSPAAQLALDLLEWYGFTPNRSKTFLSGVFRESCGSDWFDGVQVRPFYQKEIPYEIPDLLKLANGLRRKAADRHNHHGCDSHLLGAWRTAISFIPGPVRWHVVGPAHAAPTACLHLDWDEAQRSFFVVPLRDSIEGFEGLGYRPVPLPALKVTNFEGAVATLLYRLNNGESDSDAPPASLRQGRGTEFKLHRSAFYGPWTDLGPWV